MTHPLHSKDTCTLIATFLDDRGQSALSGVDTHTHRSVDRLRAQALAPLRGPITFPALTDLLRLIDPRSTVSAQYARVQQVVCRQFDPARYGFACLPTERIGASDESFQRKFQNACQLGIGSLIKQFPLSYIPPETFKRGLFAALPHPDAFAYLFEARKNRLGEGEAQELLEKAVKEGHVHAVRLLLDSHLVAKEALQAQLRSLLLTLEHPDMLRLFLTQDLFAKAGRLFFQIALSRFLFLPDCLTLFLQSQGASTDPLLLQDRFIFAVKQGQFQSAQLLLPYLDPAVCDPAPLFAGAVVSVPLLESLVRAFFCFNPQHALPEAVKQNQLPALRFLLDRAPVSPDEIRSLRDLALKDYPNLPKGSPQHIDRLYLIEYLDRQLGEHHLKPEYWEYTDSEASVSVTLSDIYNNELCTSSDDESISITSDDD